MSGTNKLKEYKCFREAADRIWDMASEYQAKGLRELAYELKDLAAQLHFIARKKELEIQHLEVANVNVT